MGAAGVQKGSCYDTVVKAVIIYDDFDSATHATALVERAVMRADEAIRWDIKLWRLDFLKQPMLADLTVFVAANADLIVLALNRIHSLPAELLDWLKNWADQRQIEDAALLPLYSNETQISLALWNKTKLFAEEHGLTVLDKPDVWNIKNSVVG